MQTLLGARALRPPPPAVSRERLELDDGDFIDLAHADPPGEPIAHACLFHGLAGGLGSAYARGAIGALVRRRVAVTLMHWRGCSGEPNRLRRSYHSGATEDIVRIAELVAERHPGRPLLGLGYSLGGNALLLHLGRAGADTPFDAALAVCPPLVLAVGAAKLDRGAARGYRRHLLGLMRAQHEAKRARHPELDLPPARPSLDTFRAFDDALTAPLHGYAGVDDYYARASSRPALPGVAVPTRVLCAEDDPFFTPAILPEADELAPETVLELARHGGHVGFVGGRGAGDGPGGGALGRRWLDRRVGEVLAGFVAERPGRRAGTSFDARADGPSG